MTDNKDKQNMKLLPDVLYADTESKDHELTVNSKRTVQPNALMRLGVFVPKPANKRSTAAMTLEASELLSTLSLPRKEGYTNIQIIGPRLDMDTDFKSWIGIIRSFSKYGHQGNEISLPFKEFASFCGFSSKRMDRPLRKKIHLSMMKIRAKTLSFTKENDMASYATGLVKVAMVDMAKDNVILEADSRIWELYEQDYRVLLRLQALDELSRNELAQTLYTFFESLPKKPYPVSFQRIRERVCLTSEVKEQNRSIKNALKQLQKIGYLDYDLKKEGQEYFINILSRKPALNKAKENE